MMIFVALLLGLWIDSELFLMGSHSYGSQDFHNAETGEINERSDTNSNTDEPSSCDLYLAQSLITGAGRGIFAGKSISANTMFINYPTLLIPEKFTEQTLLDFYVWEPDGIADYAMVGYEGPSLFNHHSNESVDFRWNHRDALRSLRNRSEPETEPVLPFSQFLTADYFALRHIDQGEEMFGSYGGDEWFTDRDMVNKDIDILARDNELKIEMSGDSSSGEDQYQNQQNEKEQNLTKYSLADLHERGFCLSDVYIDHSSIPLAGKGLFAKRAFLKGEVVTISPVLPIPLDIVTESESECLLANYVISQPGSDVTLFPFGLGAMINHKSGTCIDYEDDEALECANVKMSWLNWTEYIDLRKERRTHEEDIVERARSTLIYRTPVDDLYNISTAQKLDISFVASRHIKADEEIFLNYGKAWEAKWKQYIQAVTLFAYQKSLGYEVDLYKPSFREHIRAPPGFLPRSWIKKKEESENN